MRVSTACLLAVVHADRDVCARSQRGRQWISVRLVDELLDGVANALRQSDVVFDPVLQVQSIAAEVEQNVAQSRSWSCSRSPYESAVFFSSACCRLSRRYWSAHDSSSTLSTSPHHYDSDS